MSALQGQTRQLLQLTKTPSAALAQHWVNAWKKRFEKVNTDTQAAVIQQAFAIVYQAGQQPTISAQQCDLILAQGELLTSWLFYTSCRQQGHDVYWHDIRTSLQTDSHYGQANYTACTLTTKASGHMITQGYIGADAQGNTTTLGFEGSDYSAALVAAAVSADHLIIYKDVGAIYSANPHWLKSARSFDYLSYQQAEVLAQSGASILHPKTLRPAQQHAIPIQVSNLHHSGRTIITEKAHPNWFALVARSDGLHVLGEVDPACYMHHRVVRRNNQGVVLQLEDEEIDTVAAEIHHRIMEMQTCQLL